jgi:hypothetical protein
MIEEVSRRFEASGGPLSTARYTISLAAATVVAHCSRLFRNRHGLVSVISGDDMVDEADLSRWARLGRRSGGFQQDFCGIICVSGTAHGMPHYFASLIANRAFRGDDQVTHLRQPSRPHTAPRPPQSRARCTVLTLRMGRKLRGRGRAWSVTSLSSLPQREAVPAPVRIATGLLIIFEAFHAVSNPSRTPRLMALRDSGRLMVTTAT